MAAPSVIRVPPFQYIHVLDNNTNTQRVEVGPQTFTRQDHEKIIFGPSAMLILPPRHFCRIADPYIRKAENSKEALTDKFGQVKLRHGDQEIRFAEAWPEPFGLMPGEKLIGSISEVPLVQVDTALRLIARRDFTDEEGRKRTAGDEWLFAGPATYRPRVEVDVLETIKATLVQTDHAVRLQARKAFTDRRGVQRKAGEEWLVREVGPYLPSADEKVLSIVQPTFLLPTRALHLRALDTFKDAYGITRRAGEEWLVTNKLTETHIVDVYEESVGMVAITVLNKMQYCVVLDPVGEDGKNLYGTRQLRKGEAAFFLLPGERLEGGIQNIYVLGQEEALLLKANEKFDDVVSEPGKVIKRTPGDLWMIRGPCDYVPPVEVQVVEKRRSIPLDENEGIYVRDIKTGKVRTVAGQTYLLKAHEELWEKDLPQEVESLLLQNPDLDEDAPAAPAKKRDRTRVVSYRVPHNSAVQIYDYKAKKSRVVYGPGLVMLDPDEQFTVLSLSGSKPKRPNVIKCLALRLGPDFMTDIIEVETSDHARLRLQLSYNWVFQIDRNQAEDSIKVFQTRDFVGDACKAIAARVRGAVAAQSFDRFHKSSADLIRNSVFLTPTGEVSDQFLFTANCLAITNIDIQSVEPVDERTRESLMKSVQLAIEITTKKQERNARHDAEEIEQDARGKIEKQKINNQKDAEAERMALIDLQGACKAIEAAGSAKAEAEARATVLEIKGSSDVEQAELVAKASNIEARAQLDDQTLTQQAELHHQASLAELELSKARRLAEIETQKFKSLVSAIKPQTIKAIAQAGPEMQARLLKGLGLKGYLMTDGNSPINLFNAAKGMVGA